MQALVFVFVLLAGGVWPAPSTAWAAPAETTRPPNLLLFTIDTQRKDSFGVYGNPGGHTPNIDRLARRGVVFDRAVTAIGTTFPSHASIFTGLYPRRHGVRYNGDILEDRFETLAEILRARGWDTMALVMYGSMVSRGGLGQGFLRTSHEKTGRNSPRASAGRITAMARGLLRRKRPQPFFMWVHYFQPHSPYELTPYAEQKLAGYEGPLASGLSTKEFYALRKEPLSEEDRAALRALYDGETREADRSVGQVLEVLREAGHADHTIVVVAADHGQLLGEHGDVGHGFRLWQPVLEVPLILFDPRRPEARRVSQRVGLVDLMPTLLDLLGVEIPAGIDGRSLVPALRGEALEARPYYGEVRRVGRRHPARWRKVRPREDRDEDAVAVFRGDRKLVVQNGEKRLYDLSSDPRELSPLSVPADDPVAAELARLAASYVANKEPMAGQREPHELSPRVQSELRALGYLE